MSSETKAWQSYEEVAVYLLNQFVRKFGLDEFQSGQTIEGKRSGTKWKIDGKGVNGQEGIFIIVECRRYMRSRQTQEEIGGLAYRIMDTGASGGILVSPLGLQDGAAKVAGAENIHSVLLDENSTRTEYILAFLNELRVSRELKVKVDISVAVHLTGEDVEGEEAVENSEGLEPDEK